MSMNCVVFLVILSRFAIISLKKRELVSLLYLCCVCISSPCFTLTIPWVGLQSVIVAFPGHTHFYFR